MTNLKSNIASQFNNGVQKNIVNSIIKDRTYNLSFKLTQLLKIDNLNNLNESETLLNLFNQYLQEIGKQYFQINFSLSNNDITNLATLQKMNQFVDLTQSML